jgi:prevent-host-death family protein
MWKPSKGTLIDGPKWPKVTSVFDGDYAMQCMSAKDAKYGFGRLIDLARAEPVLVAKHGRPVVVVMSVEEYERLKNSEGGGEDRRLNKSKAPHPTRVEEN